MSCSSVVYQAQIPSAWDSALGPYMIGGDHHVWYRGLFNLICNTFSFTLCLYLDSIVVTLQSVFYDRKKRVSLTTPCKKISNAFLPPNDRVRTDGSVTAAIVFNSMFVAI